jgi:hypothetical protein
MGKFVLAVAVLVLIAGAFAGGYYLCYWQNPAQIVANPPKERKPTAPPDWKEWQYPDSQEGNSGKGGGGMMGGVSVGPIYDVVLTTSDDLVKVHAWYAKKFDSEIIAVPTGAGSNTKMNSEDKDDPIINFDVTLDNTLPKDDRDKGGARPVRAKVISIRTPRYALAINISRADGEAHTHIIISYFPNEIRP